MMRCVVLRVVVFGLLFLLTANPLLAKTAPTPAYEIAKKLFDKGATVSQVVKALRSQGYDDAVEMSKAVWACGRRHLLPLLVAFRETQTDFIAGLRKMLHAKHQTNEKITRSTMRAGFGEEVVARVIYALGCRTTRALVERLRGLGYSWKQVGKALKAAGYRKRRDLIKALKAVGASIRDLIKVGLR